MWGSNELFCKRTIHIDSKDSENYKRTESCGDFNHTEMGRSTIIAMGTHKKTVQKQNVEHLGLENLWSARLRYRGWSKGAARQAIHSIADSTLRSYNSNIEKYMTLCKLNNRDFTDDQNISVLAEYLCQIADPSHKPESCIKSVLAAVSFYFEGLGKSSPTYNSDIKRLKTALIK